MEFVAAKKSKSRKRKRNTKNKRRVARKLEVKAAARRKVFHHNTNAMRSDQSHTMEAKTFWENYKVAQDWQQRHSVAWWRSRCHALEHENQILRQKVRSQAFNSGHQSSSHVLKNKREIPTGAAAAENGLDNENDDETDDDADDEENLEFQVDKDMLNFLEQSIRHKMELKRVRESEMEASSNVATADVPFVTGEARIQAKTEDARLLYGDASPRIMAMEAALQATMDRHKDRAKPHYWPNIPLKP